MHDFLELERELAGIMQLSDLTGPLLGRLQQLVGATGSGVFSFDPDGRVSIRGGTLEHSMADYTADLCSDDVVWQENLATPPALFFATTDGLDLGEYRRCRAYADFYRPREIGSICGVRPTGLPFGTPRMFGVMFHTQSLSRSFGVENTKRLRQLEIPLRTAARRMARFRGVEHKHAALSQLLERQRGSFVLWDADGRLVCVSSQAQQQLQGPLARGELEQAAARALRQLRGIDSTERSPLLGRPRLLRSARGAPLLVEFSWLCARDQRPWLLAELQSCPDLALLLSGLSVAEGRVLRLLTSGLSNLEISQELAVSTETVKTHVKRILAKLGVSSRSKAARVAHEAWRHRR